MLQLTPRHYYTPIHQLRRHLLYRAYLRHLQRLPDPYAWSVLQPHFRSLLAIPPSPKGAQNSSSDGIQQADHAESSLQAQLRAKDAEAREAKRIRQLKRARKELYHLQDAVAFHPHALERLLDTVYGIRGRERWRLINVSPSTVLCCDSKYRGEKDAFACTVTGPSSKYRVPPRKGLMAYLLPSAWHEAEAY